MCTGLRPCTYIKVHYVLQYVRLYGEFPLFLEEGVRGSYINDVSLSLRRERVRVRVVNLDFT